MSASTAPPPVAVHEDVDRTAEQAGGRVPALASVVIVVLALVTAPFQGGLPGVATIRLVSGTAEVQVAGEWQPVEVGQRLGVGSLVRSDGDAATFESADGRIELRAGSTLGLDGLRRVTLERGAALLDVDDLWEVEVGVATVRGAGLLRVDLGSLRRVGVYRGGASVTSATGATSVEAYDQADLADADRLEPEPLRYDASDPWDARHLAAAIDVDEDVAALQRGLEAQYGDELQELAFYRDFLAVDDVLSTALPDLAPREAGARFGPVAPTLTAVVVARALVTGARLSQGEAVAEIRRERAAGATWGLLLVEHELGPRALAGATEEALRRRAIAVEEGVAAPVRRSPPTTDTGGDTGTGPQPPGDGDDGSRDPSTPPGTDPDPDPGTDPDPDPEPDPDPVPVPDEVDEVVDDTVDDVTETVDELLGTLPLPGDDGTGAPGGLPLP